MEVKFRVCKHGNFKIRVTGLEDNYQDYISITSIVKVDSKENEGTYKYIINDHSTEYDEVIFTLDQDGLYKITRILISKETPSQEDGFYYSNGNIYKDSKIVTIEEIFEQAVLQDYLLTFCMDYLLKCFYEKTNKHFDEYCSTCNNKVQDISMFHIVIHIFEYLIELGRYYEAQELLERINKCGNFLGCETIKTSDITYGCGCY